MTGWREDDTSDLRTGSPIDFDRLDVVRDRFATDGRFIRVDDQPAFAPERLVCVYDPGVYPARVQTARLEIVWFENGDFSLHYHEDHETGAFDHRWDRHPCPLTTPASTSIRGRRHQPRVRTHRIRPTGVTFSR